MGHLLVGVHVRAGVALPRTVRTRVEQLAAMIRFVFLEPQQPLKLLPTVAAREGRFVLVVESLVRGQCQLVDRLLAANVTRNRTSGEAPLQVVRVRVLVFEPLFAPFALLFQAGRALLGVREAVRFELGFVHEPLGADVANPAGRGAVDVLLVRPQQDRRAEAVEEGKGEVLSFVVFQLAVCFP